MAGGRCYTIMAVAGLLLCGSLNTIMLKVSFTVRGTNLAGHQENFQKPWFVTFVMFVAMTCALAFDRDLWSSKRSSALAASLIDGSPPQMTTPSPARGMSWKRKVRWVAAPSVFDILATGLCSTGFLYIPGSVWQLLRGAEMVFAAIFAVVFLRRRLYCFHWIGVVLCVLGIVCVGLASVWGTEEDAGGKGEDPRLLLLGMALAVGGQVVQAAQVVAEEWLLKEVDLPELQVVGFEGLWGGLIMLSIVFPLLYYLPGDDHGHLENELDAFAMVRSSAPLMAVIAVYTFSCATYNIAGIAVTGALSAVHRVMLEAFRTSVIWIFGLTVHYCFDPMSPFGEVWTKYSWIEVVGFGILMLGQAVYGEMVRLPCFKYPEAPAVRPMASPGALKSFASPLPPERQGDNGEKLQPFASPNHRSPKQIWRSPADGIR